MLIGFIAYEGGKNQEKKSPSSSYPTFLSPACCRDRNNNKAASSLVAGDKPMAFCILYSTSRLYTGIKLSAEPGGVAARPEAAAAAARRCCWSHSQSKCFCVYTSPGIAQKSIALPAPHADSFSIDPRFRYLLKPRVTQHPESSGSSQTYAFKKKQQNKTDCV